MVSTVSRPPVTLPPVNPTVDNPIAGGPDLANAMTKAGEQIDAKQKLMTDILSKPTLTAKDTAELNKLNNDISLLSSAQKSLNQAAGAAQKMIAA